MIGRQVFGRKASAPTEPTRPAQAPSGKIFDDCLFEGARGDFLRQAGYFPDDPVNDAANAQPLAVLLADDAAHLRKVVASANLTASAPLAPYQLLPVEVWRGPHGAWLRQRLGLSPYRPWNTVFLAASPLAVAEFGLPMVPEVRDEEQLAMASELVASVFDHLAGAKDPPIEVMVSLLSTLREKFPALLPPDDGDFSPSVREGRALVRTAAIAAAINGGFPSVEQIERSHRLTLAEPALQLIA